jgi:small basic protein (TIGR04137 family)
MALHPSLRIDTAGAQQRTVLSRIERIKDLMHRGLWEGKTVTGLPKSKVLRVKSRKTKSKEAAEGAATGAAPAAAGKGAPTATAAAPAAKAPAGKDAKK